MAHAADGPRLIQQRPVLNRIGMREMQGLDGNFALQLGIEAQIDNALRTAPQLPRSSKRPILFIIRFLQSRPDAARRRPTADHRILPVIPGHAHASSASRSARSSFLHWPVATHPAGSAPVRLVIALQQVAFNCD
jgi:hypothetical protein